MASDSDVELTSWSSSDDEQDELLYSANAYPRSKSFWDYFNAVLRRRKALRRPSRSRPSRVSGLRQTRRLILLFAFLWTVVIVFIGVFQPTYATYPEWYTSDAVIESGAGNPKNQKIFIAANIINADLIRGAWGEALKELVEMLGKNNVFISIYENDAGDDPEQALVDLRIGFHMSGIKSSVVTSSLPLSYLPNNTVPFIDHPFTKRITYLATVRNLAMLPLTADLPYPLPAMPDQLESSKRKNHFEKVSEKYDKVLFLNDVHFSPKEAVHLLFDTNKGDFAAACALDFDNPFKFYDTFGLRDTEGYSIGLPLYPLFTRGASRKAMLAGKDAVPVKSCWGGMIAFDAKAFTEKNVRFRSESDLQWEASECCLVHADIDDPARTFVNPFIRVSYTPFTFHYMWLAMRIERIWVYPHKFLSWIVGMPWYNPRQFETEGEKVQTIAPDGTTTDRIASRGGFCGFRDLQVVEDHPDGRTWYHAKLP